MNILGALFALLALPMTALAQAEREWRPPLTLTLGPQEVDVPRPAYAELTLGIRVPFLGGDLDNSDSKQWNDLYNSAGGGFEAKYSHLFKVSPVVAVGPYAGLTLDVFGGKTIDVDPGTGLETWDVDPWVVTRIVVGARVRETFGAFWMDQNIGLGPVIYAFGAAEDSIGFDSVELIQSSVNLTLELGFRMGVVVSRKVDLGLGMAWEFNGKPETGEDLPSTFEFKGQSNFVLTFLINLNF
jgi:hypothetical protein